MNIRAHISQLHPTILRLSDNRLSNKEIAFFVMQQLMLVVPGRYLTITPSESLELMATDYRMIRAMVDSVIEWNKGKDTQLAADSIRTTDI